MVLTEFGHLVETFAVGEILAISPNSRNQMALLPDGSSLAFLEVHRRHRLADVLVRLRH